jgi:uncharacterized phage protein gp47/JayE
MGPSTPTVADIGQNIIAQLEATLNQTIPLLPKAFNRVLAKVLAAVFVLVYKYAGFIFLQIFVKTATIEDVTILGKIISPLKEWGRLVGLPEPEKATQAQLEVSITVEVQGGTLNSGTQLLNRDNGVTYLTVGSVALNAPTVTAIVRASGDQTGGNGSGAIGNLNPADTISFANPLSVVARDAVVVSQAVTGADREDTEVYRQRIFDRFQTRAQGGALIDYKIWGEEVAGILSIYPYTGALPGHVDVFVEATVASSGSADGFPTAAQLAAVLNSITLDDAGLASRRPAGSFVNVSSITRTGFDVRVFGLSVPNPAQTQADIDAAISEYLFSREPEVSGVTVPPKKNQVTQSGLVGLVEDIVTAAGGIFTTVDFNQTGSGGSLTIYTLGQGEEAKLTGAVSFVA